MVDGTIDSTSASTIADRVGGWLQLKWLLPVLAMLAISIFLMVRFWGLFNTDDNVMITTCFSILLAAFLSALPAVLCTVQNVSRRRQLSRLDSLGQTRAARTMSFTAAVSSIDSVRMMVDADYVVPIFLYFFITFVGFIAVFIGFGHPVYFSQPTVLLGGLQDQFAGDPYTIYQTDTFTVLAMAFFGAYVYALGRLLDRINNHDLYPISLYYYTVRIIVACAAAAVLRHTIQVFSGGIEQMVPASLGVQGNSTLLLIGFIVGFAPDLFILAISRKAFQMVKIWGTRPDPLDESMPRSLPLLMIDDLTREKIDRLNELGIDSAQILARQNPFLLLPRLPFELSLLIDWIGQAQLYVLVKDAAMGRLRNIYIRNILDLQIRLSDPQSRNAVCEALNLLPASGEALLAQLEADTSYLRLRELDEALRPLGDVYIEMKPPQPQPQLAAVS